MADKMMVMRQDATMARVNKVVEAFGTDPLRNKGILYEAFAELEAENSRLREALKEIVDGIESSNPDVTREEVALWHEIARNALKL